MFHHSCLYFIKYIGVKTSKLPNRLHSFARHNQLIFLDSIDRDLTDGVLRKAEMPILDTNLCHEFLDVNASDEMHSGFICAGGKGDEESCYVSF